MSFTIEQDVPMPGRRNRYPFDTMQSKQSFEIVGEDEARKVRNAAYQYAKKVNTASAEAIAKGEEGLPEVKFALRKTGEHPDLNDEGTQKVDAEGKPLVVKLYRLWRE